MRSWFIFLAGVGLMVSGFVWTGIALILAAWCD